MKKRTIGVLMALALAFSVTACGNENSEGDSGETENVSEENEPADAEAAAEEIGNGDAVEDTVEGTTGNTTLIAYFTFPETDGTDADSGASRRIVDGEVVGSTQVIAQMIQNTAGGDLFAIETVQEYPGSHEPLVDQASEEKAEGARPELSTTVENMDQYDIVYIGYPNWWGDMPMPLYTFLEEYDLSGKTIIPFTTHGGSSLASTVQSIANEQPGANVIENGFSISRDEDITAAQGAVDTWLQEIGMQ